MWYWDCTTVTLPLSDVHTHVYGLPGMNLCLINHMSMAGRLILPGIFTNSTPARCEGADISPGSGDAAVLPHCSDPAPELGITCLPQNISLEHIKI